MAESIPVAELDALLEVLTNEGWVADPDATEYNLRVTGLALAAALLAARQPDPDAGRLLRIEHAARDVDGLWEAEDGELIRWSVEAAEALEDLRAGPHPVSGR